jgi:hypothetical protein
LFRWLVDFHKKATTVAAENLRSNENFDEGPKQKKKRQQTSTRIQHIHTPAHTRTHPHTLFHSFITPISAKLSITIDHHHHPIHAVTPKDTAELLEGCVREKESTSIWFQESHPSGRGTVLVN